MSLRPQDHEKVPADTARVAQAAFPRGNPYLLLRDRFGALFHDETFAGLFPWHGRPAEAPGRLALVTVLQFAEDLSDRQAADAVRSRLDWKYLLGLELTDAGFDASVLSEFRCRLVSGQAEQLLFEKVLSRFQEAGLITQRGRQRTDSTHVLAAIRGLHRLECVGETFRRALDALAVVAAEWLQARVPAQWYERYAHPFEEYRLPADMAERYQLAERIGADGAQLLDWVHDAPAWLREVPAVEILRRVWLQQFYACGPGQPPRWRQAADLPPSEHMICSPVDAEARYSRKRSTIWTGYKVHLTETHEEGQPHLITDVQTTPATTQDFTLLPCIQTNLARREMLPSQQSVDSGYMTTRHLLSSQRHYEIDLLGPVNGNNSWQARASQGFVAADFTMDWSAQRATCPQGQVSEKWTTTRDRHGQEIVVIRFAASLCQACSKRTACTRSHQHGRHLSVLPQTEQGALLAARARQTTPAFKRAYAARAGIEGTLSQGVRTAGLRHSRYIGLAKTHLQHLATATAINLQRIAAWLDTRPLARTRITAFARLALTPT